MAGTPPMVSQLGFSHPFASCGVGRGGLARTARQKRLSKRAVAKRGRHAAALRPAPRGEERTSDGVPHLHALRAPEGAQVVEKP